MRVCISSTKVAVEALGMPPERSIVFHSPIPDSLLDGPFNRDELRNRLHLNDDGRRLVVYNGKVYCSQREIDLILQAA